MAYKYLNIVKFRVPFSVEEATDLFPRATEVTAEATTSYSWVHVRAVDERAATLIFGLPNVGGIEVEGWDAMRPKDLTIGRWYALPYPVQLTIWREGSARNWRRHMREYLVALASRNEGDEERGMGGGASDYA